MIPQRLRDLLAGSPFESAVLDYAARVGEILHDNKLPFFPAYTDHGVEHIARVLQTQLDLVPPDVWERELLTSADAAVMILATLLHDLAMHLREPGLLDLVTNEKRRELPAKSMLADWDRHDEPWNELWDRYRAEIIRWSDAEANKRLGCPAADLQELRFRSRPEPPKNGWNDLQRLAIGEFIRRHHPRIAEETVFFGFPGISTKRGRKDKAGKKKKRPDQRLPKLAKTLPELAQLAGLVARSHGMPIREAAAALNDVQSGAPALHGCHAVYLAALLRIADYLQIDRSRTPAILLSLRHPVSPVSLDEWQKHAAVTDVQMVHSDPDAIFVHVQSDHPYRVHLLLRDLIDGLQVELDETNACLREQYGRYPQLTPLALAYSRVKTNLDSPEMQGSLPYEPERIELTVDPRVMDQLVAPIYGNRPECGIRELLQNAVDAVRERSLIEYESSVSDVERSPGHGEPEVDIEICAAKRPDGTWSLAVTDRGIGMTLQTLVSYFCRAGASYRNDPTWAKSFRDDEGRAKVLRSGRFGLGVFAVFLLGERVTVRTKYCQSKDEYGLECSFGLHDTNLEVRRVRAAKKGTSVFVVLSDTAARILELDRALDDRADCQCRGWDWYTRSAPKIIRIVQDESKAVELSAKYSPTDADSGIRKLNVADVSLKWWPGRKRPLIACNGLIIGRTESQDIRDPASDKKEKERYIAGDAWYWGDGEQMPRIATPPVDIDDPEARIPLSVDRGSFLAANGPSFSSAVAHEVAMDFVAFSIAMAPSRPPWESGVKFAYSDPWWQYYPLYQGGSVLSDTSSSKPSMTFGGPNLLSGRWLGCPSGAIPFDTSLLSTTGLRSLVVLGVCTGDSPVVHGGPLDLGPLGRHPSGVGFVNAQDWPCRTGLVVCPDLTTSEHRHRILGTELDCFIDRSVLFSMLSAAVTGKLVDAVEVIGGRFAVYQGVVTVDEICERRRIDLANCRRSSGMNKSVEIIEAGDVSSCSVSLERLFFSGDHPCFPVPWASPYAIELAIRSVQVAEPSHRWPTVWRTELGDDAIPWGPAERNKFQEAVLAKKNRLSELLQYWLDLGPDWQDKLFPKSDATE